MSFQTDPHVFRIQIRGRGGELLSPSELDFQKMVGSGGGFRGDLPGLSLIYRLKSLDEVKRLMGQLLGDLALRTQGHWREIIYQRSPAGQTRSGYRVRQSRLPVNWRGDYARAVRVRRNQYSATIFVDATITRFLLALERGSRALGQRYFAFKSESGQHPFINRTRRASTENYQQVAFGSGLDERKRSLEGRRLRREEEGLGENLRRRYEGEQGEGSQRILEWARQRFGAGEAIGYRRVTNRRGYTQKGVMVRTGIKKKETPSAIEKNAFRLLYYIRTRGTKSAGIFKRLQDSMKPGGELQTELAHVSQRWYRAVKEGGDYTP